MQFKAIQALVLQKIKRAYLALFIFWSGFSAQLKTRSARNDSVSFCLDGRRQLLMASACWGRTASETINLPLADGYSLFLLILPTHISCLYFFTVSSESVNQNFHFLSPKMASNSSSVRVISEIEVLRALRDLRGQRSLPLFIVWWHLIFHDKSENIALYAHSLYLPKMPLKIGNFEIEDLV